MDVKLRLLKELFQSIGHQALADPMHPQWSQYDSFHAYLGYQDCLSG